MIDIILMYNLLKAIPEHMTLILIGDIDQLPSIGAGNVLRDIIGSDAIPVVKLERIFRQALGSRFVTNAHKINAGEFPDISNRKDSSGSHLISSLFTKMSQNMRWHRLFRSASNVSPALTI
jgi:exodeoxyribonuclease V alpha subunit